MDNRKSNDRSPESPTLFVRCFLAVQVVCFVGSGLNHARDIWQGGWLPYGGVPLPMNAYWTALAPLDVLAAGLLLTRPKAGVALALLIMVSDVAVNSYAHYGLGFSGWYGDLALQLQSIFLGFVVGAAPLIWWPRPFRDTRN